VEPFTDHADDTLAFFGRRPHHTDGLLERVIILGDICYSEFDLAFDPALADNTMR